MREGKRQRTGEGQETMPTSTSTGAQRQAGITASNESFANHEQVSKPQYNLTETADGADAFDNGFQFETVDIAAVLRDPSDASARQAVADQLGPALAEIGFAIITGHGIPESRFDATHAAIEALFKSTPMETKLRYKAQRKGSVNQGYFPIEETSNLHPDQVEGWVFCRRAFNLANGAGANGNPAAGAFWPDVAGETFYRPLIQGMQRTVLPIMRSILTFLGEEASSFDDKLTDSNFGFRLNYYPPLSDQAQQSGTGRMLGHEDVDLFTLLPASPVEGLQVLNRKNMKWVRLQAPPGSIIINVGDYFQRITNDKLPSTTHRVAPPRSAEQRGQCRTSFPMAVYLNEGVVLECLKSCGKPRYVPETAIDFHTKITSKYYGDDYRATNGED